MQHHFITGTSSGIGKEIAEQLLQNPENHVTGFSRRCNITHERYTHVTIDLSNLDEVLKWKFPAIENAEKISLINNAGAIGEVRYAGKMNDRSIAAAYNTNLVAPTIFTNRFLEIYSGNAAKKIVINVSSGAGKNPVDGWSVYCATKAGLDMFTKTIAEELKIADQKNIFVFAVAPGVVDTEMQDQIRKSPVTDFSRIEQFVAYKTTSKLAAPDLVAGKYLSILESPEKFKEVVFSVKDF